MSELDPSMTESSCHGNTPFPFGVPGSTYRERMDDTRIKTSDDDVAYLIHAINCLGGDSHFIVQGLTDFLNAQRPVERDHLSRERDEVLIESGAFTRNQLEEAKRAVIRGSLQLWASESWLTSVLATQSLADAADYLESSEDEVRAHTVAGRLLAVDIGGHLRFPLWQFNVGRPARTVLGLSEIIAAAGPRWDWQHLSAFMETPQDDLIGEGRLTPVTWLQDIGDIEAVTSLIEASNWT